VGRFFRFGVSAADDGAASSADGLGAVGATCVAGCEIGGSGASASFGGADAFTFFGLRTAGQFAESDRLTALIWEKLAGIGPG
jgi:hypothetical protein